MSTAAITVNLKSQVPAIKSDQNVLIPNLSKRRKTTTATKLRKQQLNRKSERDQRDYIYSAGGV